MPKPALIPASYPELLSSIVEEIRAARVRAAVAVNAELAELYWRIGREINARREAEGWGAKVVERLADDLKREFPDAKGFSLRNLKYAAQLAAAWPDGIRATAVARIPWGHSIALLEKLDDPDARLWYAQRVLEHGWSRSVLLLQIGSGLRERQGQAITSFKGALPAAGSDLAQQMLRDPVSFDFLALESDFKERHLEHGLVGRVRDLIRALGDGFAFVDQQRHFEVGGQDFYIDLLFYFIPLHCYIVIDLKIDDYRPEYAGKMNFYVNVVDDQLRGEGDGPTIGVILCRDRNEVVAEQSLRGFSSPIGITTYTIRERLYELEEHYPTMLELEAPSNDTAAA